MQTTSTPLDNKIAQIIGKIDYKRELPDDLPDYMLNILNNLSLLFARKFYLPIPEFEDLYVRFWEIYKDRPNIVYLDKISAKNFNDVIIVGDIHGDLHSLLKILDPFFRGEVESIVFMGDYVDRGNYSFSCLVLVLIISVIWPDRVCLLRGNHEDLNLNRSFGFFEDIIRIYEGKEIEQAITIISNIWEYLSLIAITPQNTACMHGGIPINSQNLSDYLEIPKPHYKVNDEPDPERQSKLYNLLMQIRWNDPIEKISPRTGNKSYHGYFYYTDLHVTKFLVQNNLKRVVKSHTKMDAFKQMFDGKLVHVFSSGVFSSIKDPYFLYENREGQSFYCDLNFHKNIF